MELNPASLSFSGDGKYLEPLFLEDFYLKSLDHVRQCKLFAILFISIFGILDAFIFPEYKLSLWFIRYVIVCPVFIIGFAFSYSKYYKEYWQELNALYVVVSGISCIAMVAIAPSPKSYFYIIGAIFCVFFGYTYVHARFITATIAGLIVMAGLELVLTFTAKVPWDIHLIISAHFFGINILGMVICYSIETSFRKDFFLNQMLMAEKDKVGKINRTLEKRVEERTADLKSANKSLSREIIERKEAEARVSESYKSLATILDGIDADIYVVDIESHSIILMNQHMKNGLGKGSLEKPCYKLVTGKEVPCDDCLDDNLFDKNGNPGKAHSWEGQNPITGKWYVNYVKVIQWVDGSLVKLHVATDVTKIREMEEKLQRAQKMEAIGALAGGVAHDLNNILSGLVGYPEIVLLELPEDSHLSELVAIIKQSGERAAAIVQDMLTLARRGVAVTKVVNLNEIISDYMKSPEMEKLKTLHPAVEFKTVLADDLNNIQGSAVHLSKTIMNLVINAAEATYDGGIIKISTRNKTLDHIHKGFENIAEGDYAVLKVSDTGTGIEEKDIKQIFEPFYTKKEMGISGTGLGMAVVWGTVKDHNGYIDVKTKVGKGTSFTLNFPSTIQKAVVKEKDLSLDAFRGNGECILVVDDVKEQRELAFFMLKRLGYNVIEASNATSALFHIKDTAVDLLVLDMIMASDMDGLEIYKQAISAQPGLKAVITSGYSESESIKAAQQLGAGAYIKKPYTIEKLGLAVKKELKNSSRTNNKASA